MPPHLRLRAAAAGLTIAAALLVTLTPATADPSPRHDQSRQHVLVTARDPAHDANLTGFRGLSKADRRSIDMRRLTLTRHGRYVRFAVRLDEVARTPRFTQLFLITLRAPGYQITQMQFASHSLAIPSTGRGLEHMITTEGTPTPQGFVSCDLKRFSFRDGAQRWWVDVPLRCLPRAKVRLDVYAQTIQPPESDESAQYSNDTLRIKGTHALGGTIPRADS